MRVLLHEPYFLVSCLMLFLLQEFHRFLRPFESEDLLVMLPGGSENVGKATLSD